MKVKSKQSLRSKRSASSLAEVVIVLLVVLVAGVIGLLLFVYPNVPGLSQSSKHVVASAPTSVTVPVSGIQTAPTSLPPGSVFIANPKMPLTIVRSTTRGVKLVLVEGGVLGTRRSPIRQGVQDFVREAGAIAGINGTFFANASLTGTDNLLIGPSLCDNEPSVTFSPFDSKPELEGRPMVLVSASSTCIVPFDNATMGIPGAIQSIMPGVTDAFLGGVWLVHNGVASTLDQLALYNVHDSEDPRRRAFFALMPDGRPVLGATDGSEPSSLLALALADAGVKEAVLLDSGFSTSLVFQQTVLVTGHSTRTLPSRPVPHALVLFGEPDPTAINQLQQVPTS